MNAQKYAQRKPLMFIILVLIAAVFTPTATRSTNAAALGCAIGIGQGSPNPQVFLNTYYNEGGQAVWNCPIEPVQRSGNGYVQQFQGGAAGNGVLTLADSASQAYWAKSGIGRAWAGWGMGVSVLDYPIGREFIAGKSPTGTKGWGQQYRRGYIHHWTNGRVYYTVNEIMRIYTSCGGSSGKLGFPTTNELNTSFGWVSYFELGRIEAYHNGQLNVFDQRGNRISC